MKNKIYAIRFNVPYGEFLYIISAKDRREARALTPLDYDGKIVEMKQIKPTKKSKLLIMGGSRE